MSLIKKGNNKNLTPREALQLIEKNSGGGDLVVLDVRTPWEFSEGSVPGARNLDFTDPDFMELVNELDRNKTYIVYCKTGKRSDMFEEVLKEKGFNKIYTVNGGFEAIKKELKD